MNPKGGMFLFRALGGLGNEGQQGQKMKKFWKKISKIFLMRFLLARWLHEVHFLSMFSPHFMNLKKQIRFVAYLLFNH